MGIVEPINSTAASFFDYDLDGDLDLLMVNAPINSRYTAVSNRLYGTGDTLNADKLYENIGGTFKDVTFERGLKLEDFYGLACYTGDLDMNGSQDIYVCNDYFDQDLAYYNDGKGNFRWVTREAFTQSALFAMGIDVADINNDMLPDIISVDMLQESLIKQKEEIVSQNFEVKELLKQYQGTGMQRSCNALQLNLGNGTFAEIGRLVGVHATEWSWTPLVFDFDNNGWNDIYISNGVIYTFPEDFINYEMHRLNREREEEFREMRRQDVYTHEQLDSIMLMAKENAFDFITSDDIPRRKTVSYFYENQKDLTFRNRASDWGLTDTLITTGAAYADFDQDGDLEIVAMNLDHNISFFKNTTRENNPNSNYLQVALDYGKKGNRQARGAKVYLYAGEKSYYREIKATRGYVSASEPIAHFGLGDITKIDSIVIYWPEKLDKQVVIQPKINNRLVVRYQPGKGRYVKAAIYGPENSPYLTRISNSSLIEGELKHEENKHFDSKVQPTILCEYSILGPGLAVADVNGDGLEDFYMGGARGSTGKLMLQSKNGKFSRDNDFAAVLEEDASSEDVGALFFDADGDGDQDLYVVSGGSSLPAGDAAYQDRLYLNNGKGKFAKAPDMLPEMLASGTSVSASDFDADGDLDIFVTGRVTPGAYPKIPASFLLENTKGTFKDVTDAVAPGLKKSGMINFGLWTDFDQDGDQDLFVAGEFMPLTVWRNDNGKFAPLSDEIGLENTSGWWNTIIGGDFDADGDTDYIAGNFGLNMRYKASPDEPLTMYGVDIDGNGTMDPLAFAYNLGEETCLHSYNELVNQAPLMRRKFIYVSEYARSGVDSIIPPELLKDALKLRANMFRSVYLENKGGSFDLKYLPQYAQISPVFGGATFDYNQDGNLDVMLVGNYGGFKANNSVGNAMQGLILFGNGRGGFETVEKSPLTPGLKGDARAVSSIKIKGKPVHVVSLNKGEPAMMAPSADAASVTLDFEAGETSAVVFLDNGAETRFEHYFGQSYASGSNNWIAMPAGAVRAVFYKRNKESREVHLNKP